MSETKRTVEGQVCRFCGRLLPLTYFPLKPGMKHARYKACRDCHPLGHSCIPKQKPEPKRRKFATEEERKEARREYQRQWMQTHREQMREKRREWYDRKKQDKPKKAPRAPKPKRTKLTDEERKARQLESSKRWNREHKDYIREYQRKRYHLKREEFISRSIEWQKEHKEERRKSRAERKAKAEQEAASTGRFYCAMCHHIKPAEDFTADGRQYKMCNDCREKQRARRPSVAQNERKPKGPHGSSPRVEYHRQYWQDHKEEIKADRVERAITIERKKKEPEDKLCWKCWMWPCFEGIENMDSDFAKEGCKSFNLKEDAS